jgi:hypothetical protein
MRAVFEYLDPNILEDIYLPCSYCFNVLQSLFRRRCPNLRNITIAPDGECIDLIADRCPKLEVLSIDSTSVVVGKSLLILSKLFKLVSQRPHVIVRFNTLYSDPVFAQILQHIEQSFWSTETSSKLSQGFPASNFYINDVPLWVTAFGIEEPPTLETIEKVFLWTYPDGVAPAETLGIAMRGLIRNFDVSGNFNAAELIQFFVNHVNKTVGHDDISSDAIFAVACLIGIKVQYDDEFVEDELLSDFKRRVLLLDQKMNNVHTPDCIDDWTTSEGLPGLLMRLDRYLLPQHLFWYR